MRQEILLTRNRLHDYFRARSSATGIVINPIVDDDKTTVLVRRLYEESNEQRFFTVNLPHYGESSFVDYFFDTRGPNDAWVALAIFTNSGEEHFPIFWDAYVKWMHEGASEKALEDLFPPRPEVS